MQQKKRLLSMLLLLLPLLVSAQRRLDLSNYQLVWNDEFDSYSDNPTGTNGYLYQLFQNPNSKWKYGPPYNLRLYMENPSDSFNFATAIGSITENNVRITHEGNNGFLNLYAQTQDTTVREFGPSGRYKQVRKTSSLITSTYNKDFHCDSIKGFSYGVFEIRAKLSEATDDYAAFWLWSSYWQCANSDNHLSCLGDPDFNIPRGPGWEIDIFETTKHDNGITYFSTIQPNGYATPACTGCATYYNWLNSDPANSYHTYAMAWTPTSMTWYIDGNEVRTQTSGVPKKIKMDLILSNYRLPNFGHSGSYKIDYVRVYRPNGYGFTTLLNSYQGSTYVGQYFCPGWWSDPPMQQYSDSYISAPHSNPDDNYRFFPIGKKLSSTDFNALGLFDLPAYNNSNISRSTATYTTGTNTKFYCNILGKLYSQDFSSTFTANTSFTDLTPLRSDLASFSALAIEPSTGNLFYQTNDNGLACRYYANGVYNTSRLDFTENTYPKDVSQDLAFAPANSFHPARVYYRSLSSNRLCYYEWCSSQSRWFRHITSYTNVAGDIVIASNPAGKIYYRGVDGYIWNVWTYSGGAYGCNNNNVTNWQASPFSNINIPNDCLGDLCLQPDGTKIWYRANGNRLAYIDFATNMRTLTEVKDLSPQAALKIKVNTDGKIELFYIAQNKELKTYYQRKAPAVNGQTQWQCATLDVFSSDLSSPAMFRPEYGIAPLFDINTAGTTQIYCFSRNNMNLARGSMNAYLGAYKKGEELEVLVSYNNCSSGSSISNIDGMASPPPHWLNRATSNSDPKNSLITTGNGSSALSLSPNPTNNTSRLNLPEDWCGSQVRVINSTGQVLEEYTEVCQGIDINLTEQANGLYLIYVIHNNKTSILKLLKSQ